VWVDVISVVARALSFVAQLQLAGTAIFIAMFGRQLQQSRGVIVAIGRYLAAAAVVLVVLHYLLEAARMAGDFSGMFDLSMQRISLHSTIAVACALRLAAIVSMIGTLSRHTNRSLAAYIGAALLGLAFTVTGHTAVHPLRYLLAPLLWLHIAIVAFWFGALWPLYVATTRETPSIASQIIQRFSTRAAWSVPLIGIAGVVMTWTLLPSLNALLEPYGELLVFKFASFIALMMLAALNKWRLGPAIAQGKTGAVNMFRRVVMLEYAVIFVVLCVTATMTGLFSPDQ
jgi:putative copper resistance protein D